MIHHIVDVIQLDHSDNVVSSKEEFDPINSPRLEL
jgi:hypothetical protein